MRTPKISETALNSKFPPDFDRLLELIPLCKTRVTADNRIFVDYGLAMDLLQRSRHPHQLAKRQAKYPDHIQTIQETVYISLEYLELLTRYFKCSNLKTLLESYEHLRHNNLISNPF